jgi:DNA-binding response OmpR family regulator
MVSKRILLVEDDDTLSGIITRNLEARGHSVVLAKTAEQALSKIVEDQPDLVLLDIVLPDRPGWDILRRLQDYDISPPVVVISAVRVSLERLREFKPLAYLPKPFPLEALLRVVDQAGVDQHRSSSKEQTVKSVPA